MIAVTCFYIFTLGKALLDELDIISEGFLYYVFAVVFRCDTRIDKGAIIKRVAPEGSVGVGGGEELAGFLDLVDA